jgi:hypothetical protein
LCVFIVFHRKCPWGDARQCFEKFWKKYMQNAMWCEWHMQCDVNLELDTKNPSSAKLHYSNSSSWRSRNEIAVEIVQYSYLTWGGDVWQPWLGGHLFLETHLSAQESHHHLFSCMKLLLIMSFTHIFSDNSWHLYFFEMQTQVYCRVICTSWVGWLYHINMLYNLIFSNSLEELWWHSQNSKNF